MKEKNDVSHCGALAGLAEFERSPTAAKIPVLRDCAAGIADVQVRNRGTIGGLPSEADPRGHLGHGVLELSRQGRCVGPSGGSLFNVGEFLKGAYTTPPCSKGNGFEIGFKS